MANIKRLAVKQRKIVAGVMEMYQSSDQGVLKVKCEWDKMVDFTENLVLYKLVAGMYEKELQKELLTKAKLTLARQRKWLLQLRVPSTLGWFLLETLQLKKLI